MAKEQVFPKGIRTFPKNDKAPDFVKGTVIITLNELVQFCKDNPQYLSEYNGQKQLKLQLLDGKEGKGLYFTVDTWKPGEPSAPKAAAPVTSDGDLPF